MSNKLQPKQEQFAVNVVVNGGDKVKARKDAGYSTAMSKASQGVDADKLFNHAKISLRIKELQIEADKVASKVFGITIEQRLRWLKEVAEAGLTKQLITKGEDILEQRENLPAVTGAVRVMNEMLGTDELGDETKPVKVYIGVEDAS
ncbi:hypothetical protein N9878_01155 [bacterium]|nr:hypothetical protein [bacterium]